MSCSGSWKRVDRTVSDLTPDQIRRMKVALVIVSAQLNDDVDKANALFLASGSELGPLVDGTFELAVALSTLLGGMTGNSVASTLQAVQPVDVAIVPGASVNWGVGVAMVEAVRTGDPRTVEIGSQVD